MSREIKYSLNKTQGYEFEILCVKCTGKTAHKVMVSADLRGTEGTVDYSVDWATDYQIVQCLGCKTISFREENSNSEDIEPIDNDGNFDNVITENLYPSRVDGLKGIGDEKYYLPLNVRRIYDETFHALINQSPILAAIGLRALIETICKEKNASGGNLLEKIDDLLSKGVITPTGTTILHKIRSLGNTATHEVKPHSDKQLALAMDIIEHLLKEVYIIPKQVEAEF